MSAENAIRSASGRPPCTLVMAPTRELAIQVSEQFKMLAPCGVQVYCIYGGARYEPQESAMKRGIDILVGTPGRILDHMNRGNLNLTSLSHVVLDEADQMLERGFSETVEEILSASYRKDNISLPQMMLFSATVPSWVEDMAKHYMGDDQVVVDLIGKQRVRTAVTVEHKAICCPYQERPTVINDVIQVYSGSHGRTMVFTQTKQDADELAVNPCLSQDGRVLHGDIVQKQREVTLRVSFRVTSILASGIRPI
jgi:superfamily II DNA/RNA helicase